MMLKPSASPLHRAEPVLSRAPGGPARPFTIVVAGEFNAGKSSVIDLLLDRPVLPRSAEDTHLPPVTLRRAETEGARALAGGVVLAEGDAAEIFAAPPPGADAIEVDLVSDLEPGVVLREVSITLDQPDFDARLALIADADALVWCTMAQRAWTLTESTVMEGLPPGDGRTAILAVTRQDLLPDQAAMERVLERLETVAADNFAYFVMVDSSRETLAAGSAARAASGGDDLRRAIDAVRNPPAPRAAGQGAAEPAAPAKAAAKAPAASRASEPALTRRAPAAPPSGSASGAGSATAAGRAHPPLTRAPAPRPPALRLRQMLDRLVVEMERGGLAGADAAPAQAEALAACLSGFLEELDARWDLPAAVRGLVSPYRAALAAQAPGAAAALAEISLQMEEDLTSAARQAR
ncbi:dynamin family protein [Rhodovulum sp. DZ06]|uniref:dynamin family protein n=1 Tax=Rhodovulum sp. DZ06 TaxID=3425126 RepID=UPI003D33717E